MPSAEPDGGFAAETTSAEMTMVNATRDRRGGHESAVDVR